MNRALVTLDLIIIFSQGDAHVMSSVSNLQFVVVTNCGR
jgi:hypothetical protein